MANALDHRGLLQRALAHLSAQGKSSSNSNSPSRAAASSWVAVFEDDLLLTTSPATAAARVRGALGELPGDADTLHLEYCFDACDKARFGPQHVFVTTAHRPYCSAAIMYSEQVCFSRTGICMGRREISSWSLSRWTLACSEREGERGGGRERGREGERVCV
jgi:hypothetical protein